MTYLQLLVVIIKLDYYNKKDFSSLWPILNLHFSYFHLRTESPLQIALIIITKERARLAILYHETEKFMDS